MPKAKTPNPEKDFRTLMRDVTAIEGMRTHEVLNIFLGMAFHALKRPSLVAGGNADSRKEAVEENEAAYLALVKRFRSPEKSAAIIKEMLNTTVEGLERNGMEDFLGPIFMDVAGNAFMGQFFTPPEVSRLMAHISMGHVPQSLQPGQVFTIHEPTCGFGAMVLSTANVLREHGVDPSRQAHFTMVDIDITCVRASFIQATLCAVSATVIHGNTLTLDEHSQHETIMARLYPKKAAWPANTPDLTLQREMPTPGVE